MIKKISYGILAVFALFIGTLSFNACGSGTNDAEKAAASDSGVDFTFKNLNGEPVSLSDFRGKVVFVNFWATWCPPCRQEIPAFIKLYDKHRDKGFEILGLATDVQGKEVVEPFVKDMGITYPVLLALDSKKITDVFGIIKGIPTTFVIDENGEIYKKYVGYMGEQQDRYFEEDIQTLLAKAAS